MSTDYDIDYHNWALEQARLLRAGNFDQLDSLHLAEEIEDLGKRERRALKSRLGVLLGHLLKWQYQPDYPHRKSWRSTIRTQRRAIQDLLSDNPSLQPRLDDLIASAYADALDLAIAETPLDEDDFPERCPWRPEQILGDYWPA